MIFIQPFMLFLKDPNSIYLIINYQISKNKFVSQNKYVSIDQQKNIIRFQIYR